MMHLKTDTSSYDALPHTCCERGVAQATGGSSHSSATRAASLSKAPLLPWAPVPRGVNMFASYFTPSDAFAIGFAHVFKTACIEGETAGLPVSMHGWSNS